MTTINSFIKKHPLRTFFTLAFAISWGCLLLVLGPDGFLGIEEPSETLLPLMFLAVLAGPSIAGLYLTGVMYGRNGYRGLLSRLFKWRVSIRWYAAAILTAPILISITLFALSTYSPQFLPGIIASEDKVSFLLAGIMGGLAAGIFEELGWTGFAVPELRKKYGVLITGIIMGALWGAWHLPLFTGSARSSSTIPMAVYLFVLLFTVLPAYRVLMVWVYDHTESLGIAILMHTSLTASTMILQPQTTGLLTLIYDITLALALWIVIAVIAVINRGHLSRYRLKGQAT